MSDPQKNYYGWRLFSRKEKVLQGHRFFFERWVHDESRSGIIFFSYLQGALTRFVVEGYGIGTINPRTFGEIADIAPIQRSEHDEYQEAKDTLARLMEDNYMLWKRHKEDAR